MAQVVRGIQSQRNNDMLQRAQFMFADNSRNTAPFKYNQNGRMNEMPVLASVPSMFSDLYRNPLPAIGNEQTRGYNRPNQQPRTMMNYAQPSYGNARNQVSMITNFDMNQAGKPLVMDNKKDFQEVQEDLNVPRILQRPI
jgi:hypothetical protein